jgi:putative phosphoesterase
LRRIAPVSAVRGNNDRDGWAARVPDRRVLRIGGVPILVLHDVKELRDEPAPRATQVVIAGHSHVPVVREEGGVLHLNPGSAGPRRFNLPVSVALLEIAGGKASARVVTLL